MSNILSATPTIDDNASHFSEPTWEVKVNSVTNPDAVLGNVVLSYGSSASQGEFTIHQDPDTGTFPSYNDSVEILINGQSVLKGKIKGIKSEISRSGLRKTFTVLSNITTLQETVVDIDDANFNTPDIEDEDRLTSTEIVSQILGYVPDGLPDEDPGEINVTDMTLLEAVETVVRRLGNYRLFWNQDSDLLEVYRFDQGGDVQRTFEKGVNILASSITENRQSVVDKVTIVGPPRAVRVRHLVDAALEPDDDGVLRLSFTINDDAPREIVVEGSKRPEPSVEYQGHIQVSPEDMGLPVETTGTLKGFAIWPFFPFAQDGFGNTSGDIKLRTALKSLVTFIGRFSRVAATPVPISKDQVKMIVSEAPQVWFTETRTAFVDAEKLGLVDSLGNPISGPVSISVLTRKEWFRGALRVTYTKDGDRPEVSVGSGTVERTITDSQYQIISNDIDVPNFDNDTEVLERMQERADAEYERLNRPEISGTITIPGDETVGLRSAVILNSQALDVTRVTHSFDSGFTTSVELTNEPFVALSSRPFTRPERRASQEQAARTRFRIGFNEFQIDQNIASQREDEFRRKVEEAGLSFATYQR